MRNAQALANSKMKVLLCAVALLAVVHSAPSTPEGRVIGGSNASRGQFPNIVSLQYCLLGICQHSCGGTILSPSWVLTAAHCITELPNIGTINVLAGILNLNDDNVERQYISISRSVLHPDYAGGVNPHDIAVLRLSSGLLFNSQVQPIRLPAAGAEPEGPAQLAGWGSVGGIIFPQMPNTLQWVNAPVVPIRECDSALTAILQGGNHPLDFISNVCSGPLDQRISACNGDSGGPLLQGDVIIGIVSWGINPCGTVGAPSVYAKVSNYIDWISRNVDEALQFESV